ncbi:hypothetical protein ABB37_02158 [Leptomonas pyrrhocoris]|uniref:Uncharacterized protein n=1 Tax=Leptomonas pyrrhocoris TaxID=157538 RepID=A0A0M9G7L5_LEPPY|nr:hypothetical protein ABB37_02158 [Leptomonas pyrrhocoris]KPA84026.1 hypothetical protein ABB37_02158 [Leptomonas pyrrhocoris]|eukprot:XP_015662465.1 hypothetical protein ABB37_02158 [Leptomonas pyrrhocoris]
MSSPSHSPYRMQHQTSPYGDVDDEASDLPPSLTAAAALTAQRSSSANGKNTTTNASTNDCGGDTAGQAAPSAMQGQVQRRLSDANASHTTSMGSSLTRPLSSPSRKAPPSSSKAETGAMNLTSQQQQQQQKEDEPQKPPPPPSSSTALSPAEVQMPTIAPSTAVPRSRAPHRTVGFVDTPAAATVVTPRQPSTDPTDLHVSVLTVSGNQWTSGSSDVETQRPSEASTEPARNSARTADTTSKEADKETAVPAGAEAPSATRSQTNEPTQLNSSTDEGAGDRNGDTREEGAGDNRPSTHSRYKTAYANLVIKKPSQSNTPDTCAIATDGTTMLPGMDPRDEAQIRAAGTLNSARLPVFDRAKQVLLTPGLNNLLSPRGRHSRTASNQADGAFAHTRSNSNSTTPLSAVGQRFTTLITPLLRTPVHRQQSSGISSPLIVDYSLLEVPAQSPATFGAQLTVEDDTKDDESVKTHMVWQIRTGRTHFALSPDFLLIPVNDRVCIHWYDDSEEVFETDNTYLNVVPGGRHSCYNVAATPLEANEMQDVSGAPGEDNRNEASSHALGRTRDSPPGAAALCPPTEVTGAGRKGGISSPVWIRVRTPRTGRTDSFGESFNQMDPGARGPPTLRQGLRARRFASEVFMTREEDDGGSGVDAAHHPRSRSDTSWRDANVAVSSATPLITNHSRQPSANWMVQRSVTRQSFGENYQSFTIFFRKPGEYYFVCSKHKRTMRLHVQVQSKKSLIRWRYVFVVAAALLVVALIVIVVVVLAYWMHHSTYLYGSGGAATDEQYIAFLHIHDLITMKLFPFLAVGVLVILLVILAAIGWAVYRCFHPARQGAYTRGVRTNTRRVFVCGTVLLTSALIVLLFVAFGLEMNVMNGVNQLALSLGSGVTNTLNLYSTAVLQVNYAVNETKALFPDIDLPVDKIYNITDEVSSLMSQVIKWTSFVEDIAQVAFRAIPIVIYLAMQLGLFAACLTIGALILDFRNAAVATTWMLAASLGVISIVCGIEFAITILFRNVYSSVVVLRDDPADFGATLGLANDSFVAELLSYCTITVADVSVISNYVNSILSSINSTLDAKGQQEFSTAFQFFQDMVPTTLEALVNDTDYALANLDTLQRILDENGDQVNALIHDNVVSLLRTVLTVVQTLEGLLNCQVIRDIVSAAIPILENEVKSYNTAVFAFLIIVFAVNFVLLFFSAGAAYALRHPRRTWCNMRTGRWFRFRYSFKTHLHTLMQGTKAKARDKTVLHWMVHHTQPIMYQLQSVRLICYSACALMFFDCILIVLFDEVSRGTRTSKMLQALTYLGCAVLLFLLLAALFRRAFIRRIFRSCSLLCAAACLGLSLSQTIVGFVYFFQCLNHTRYETSSLTYGSPVYMTCSATYMGYNLEVAIYAVIIFLNSITVVVTLVIYLRYERNLQAIFQRRHYVGFLSPLEGFFPCLRCIFVDYLFVKRICHGLLIFVTILFLVLFAVLDVGQWSVIRGVTKKTLKDSDMIQVIDPEIGCNGDAKYCDLRANEIIWACAHNAHSSLEDGFVLPNHYYNITHQLTAGVRSFMVDVWYDKVNSSISDEEDVYVCHMVCLMGRRRWRDIAREFKEFLDQYPEQVIMIIFEQYVNSSSLGEISDDVGLTQYVWRSEQVAPNFNPDYKWPTLRQLIASKQRAMVFNDEPAISNLSLNCPDWLYYSFDYQYENYYETPNVSSWVCDIHRGWCTDDPKPKNCTNSSGSSDSSDSTSNSGCGADSSLSAASDSHSAYLISLDITNCTVYGADPLWRNGSAVYNAVFHTNPPNIRSKMSTMNHFITRGGGSPVHATEANQPQQIQSTTFMCSSTWNTVVNILAFDFWNIANPLGTIESMNQNIAKHGKESNFRDQWSKMLFGTDTGA